VTPELQSAIDDLYGQFARYPLNLRMTACDCCVDAKTYAALFDGPLRELDQGQLSHFAFKAATTWGTRDDYRHFLPRIFELMTSADGMDIAFAPWLQARKLEYTRWRGWPKKEQAAIKSFWYAWFRGLAQVPPPESTCDPPDRGALVEAYAPLNLDLKPVLEEWSRAGVAGVHDLISAVVSLDSDGRVTGLLKEYPSACREYEAWLRDPARLAQLG